VACWWGSVATIAATAPTAAAAAAATVVLAAIALAKAAPVTASAPAVASAGVVVAIREAAAAATAATAAAAAILCVEGLRSIFFRGTRERFAFGGAPRGRGKRILSCGDLDLCDSSGLTCVLGDTGGVEAEPPEQVHTTFALLPPTLEIISLNAPPLMLSCSLLLSSAFFCSLSLSLSHCTGTRMMILSLLLFSLSVMSC